MHAISAVQYYALRCNALHCLPTTIEQFVSHTLTHTHACIIHTCAQKRRAAKQSINALDKDPTPPHERPRTQAQSTTLLPITKQTSKKKKPK